MTLNMRLLRVAAVDRAFRYFVRRKRHDRREECTKHRTISTKGQRGKSLEQDLDTWLHMSVQPFQGIPIDKRDFIGRDSHHRTVFLVNIENILMPTSPPIPHILPHVCEFGSKRPWDMGERMKVNAISPCREDGDEERDPDEFGNLKSRVLLQTKVQLNKVVDLGQHGVRDRPGPGHRLA